MSNAPAGLLLAALLVLPIPGHAAEPVQPPAPATDSVVLVTAYADGRTTYRVATASSRTSWTPFFPTVLGWVPPSGVLPVTGLKYVQVLASDGAVRVDVSVLRGPSREREDHVATVTVSADRPVVVEALGPLGVQPVTLSLTRRTPTSLHQPQVINNTAGLEVTGIELVTDAARPHYRIVVSNLSSQPAMNFHFVTYRAGRRSLSGNRGHVDATPIIEPGGTYAFTIDPSGGAAPSPEGWSPLPHDVVEIAAVLWADGTVEGEPSPMASALMLYIGREVQLGRGVALLRQAMRAGAVDGRQWLIDELQRLTIEPDAADAERAAQRLRYLESDEIRNAVPTLRTAMADMRRRMQADAAAAPAEPVAFARWLAETTARYEAWRERLRVR